MEKIHEDVHVFVMKAKNIPFSAYFYPAINAKWGKGLILQLKCPAT